MLSVLHHMEDVQVACFAVIFGLMVFHSRKDRTIRCVWCSYLLASIVSVLDVAFPHPQAPVLVDCIFIILNLRYALFVAAMVHFTGTARSISLAAYALAASSLCLLVLWTAAVPQNRVLAVAYALLGVQLLIAAVVTLRSSEPATRVSRGLLAALFLTALAFRCSQVWAMLGHLSPNQRWWSEQSLFVNSTIVGCLLPFSIMWLITTRAQNGLLKQSLVDPLTELLNRRGMADAAYRELARYTRGRQDFAVAIIDLDHFKMLNDTHGHACGDKVLRSLAVLFRETLRLSDVISRSGGEEFDLLLPLTSEQDAFHVMERLRATLEKRPLSFADNVTLHVTASIGLTCTRGRRDLTWETLHHEADLALYAAKRGGRNRVAAFVDLPEAKAAVSAGTTHEDRYSPVEPLPTA